MKSELKRVLALSWITYAIFYFLRVNFSIAMPGIMEEYGVSKVALGVVTSAFFTMYAIGQFVNGQLADNIGPKKLIAIGLGASIILNLFIPWIGGAIGLLTLVWALNGLFQSMGWSPNVKIVSAWFGKDYKGRAAGILGTSYIVGGALSWVLAGYLASAGWRYTFYIPSLLAALVLGYWLLFGQENPEGKRDKTSLAETLRAVLTDRRVLFAGMGLFGLNIVRYGFLTWAPTYFFEVQRANITTAMYKALIFPVAGALGALTTGYLTDKVFKSDRTRVGVVMSIILLVSALMFAKTTNWLLGLGLLSIIGFTTFGPHSLLVSQLPMVLGNRKNTGSITGAIDALGYLGASLTGIVSGWLIDKFAWSFAFYFWVSGAAVAGIFIYLSQKAHRS